jgi:hypothetical protein
MGFLATVSFIWKIIKWIGSSRGDNDGPGRPPMNPTNEPLNPPIPPIAGVNVDPLNRPIDSGPRVIVRSPIVRSPIAESGVINREALDEVLPEQSAGDEETYTETVKETITNLVNDYILNKRGFLSFLDGRSLLIDKENRMYAYEIQSVRPKLNEVVNELDLLFSKKN